VNPASLCIGTSEPAFIISLATGVAGSLVLGVILGKMERTAPGSQPLPQAWRHLAWFAALATVVVIQLLLLDRLFGWRHPGLVLCTSLVWKWFFLPPIVLFVTGALWGVRERNRHASKAG
jgi:hypothetical protein